MRRWTGKLQMDKSGLKNLERFRIRMSADPGVRAAIIAEEGSMEACTALTHPSHRSIS